MRPLYTSSPPQLLRRAAVKPVAMLPGMMTQTSMPKGRTSLASASVYVRTAALEAGVVGLKRMAMGAATELMFTMRPPPAPHDGQHRVVHVHHAEEVHIELTPGLLRRRELDRAGDAEARVVDQDVDAPLAAQDLGHGGVDLRLVRHIRLQMRHARLRVFGAGG